MIVPFPQIEKTDSTQILDTLRRWTLPKHNYEIRVLRLDGTVGAGLYRSDEDGLEKIAKLAKEYADDSKVKGCYLTLNPVKAKSNELDIWRPNAGITTADHKILKRTLLLLDFDGKGRDIDGYEIKNANVPSTDREHQEAIERAAVCRDILKGQGWPDPFWNDSGNGSALLYRIDLANDTEGRDLVQAVIALINEDTAVFNAGRISRLPGTWNRKPNVTAERPHRISQVIDSPAEWGLVTKDQLQAIFAVDASIFEPLRVLQPRRVETQTTTKPKTKTQKPKPALKETHAVLTPSKSTSIGEKPEVTEWLEERFGVAHHGPDGTSYKWSLERCPWREGHSTGEGDAGIYRNADHSYGFKCFHDSCQRNGRSIKDIYAMGFPGDGERLEEEFKAAGLPTADEYMAKLKAKEVSSSSPSRRVAEAAVQTQDSCCTELAAGKDSRSQGTASFRRPEIVVNARQLREVTAEAMSAIKAGNSPARWFSWGGVVVRLEGAAAKPLGADDIRYVLSEVADWYKVGKNSDRYHVYPPDHVTRNVLACPDRWLPNLNGIYTSPVFVKNRLLSRPGYDPDSGLYLTAAAETEVPLCPSLEQIRSARNQILDVLCDFPFAGDADKAHAFALILLPFCRPLIDGPTPMHVIDAPSEGTGKGLLAEVFALIATGQEARITTEPRDDAEWAKVITSVLMTAPGYVFIDNVTRPVHSPALAGAITARIHKERVLGQSKMVECPVNNVWLMTGNNIHGSREMTRRFVWIRMDAQVEMPALRSGFQHPNLIQHVMAIRQKLVTACLTLVQAWVSAGKPAGDAGSKRLGSFENWSDVMHGLLTVVGVPGLLGNTEEMMSQVNTSDQEYRTMIEVWRVTHGEKVISAGELLNSLDDAGIILSGLETARTDRGRVIKLGFLLANLVGRVFGRHKVAKAENPQHNAAGYRLSLLPEVDRTSGSTSGNVTPLVQNPSGDLPEVPDVYPTLEKRKFVIDNIATSKVGMGMCKPPAETPQTSGTSGDLQEVLCPKEVTLPDDEPDVERVSGVLAYALYEPLDMNEIAQEAARLRSDKRFASRMRSSRKGKPETSK